MTFSALDNIHISEYSTKLLFAMFLHLVVILIDKEVMRTYRFGTSSNYSVTGR